MGVPHLSSRILIISWLYCNRIIHDLLKMNVAPTAIMQMLKSMRGHRRKKGPSSNISTSSTDSGSSKPQSAKSDPTSTRTSVKDGRPSSARPDVRPPSRSRQSERWFSWTWCANLCVCDIQWQYTCEMLVISLDAIIPTLRTNYIFYHRSSKRTWIFLLDRWFYNSNGEFSPHA